MPSPSSHSLVETSTFSVLRQVFMDRVLGEEAREVQETRGWTDRGPEVIARLYPEARHVGMPRMDLWLATLDGVQVLAELEGDGEWHATVSGNDAGKVAAQLQRIVRALPGGEEKHEQGLAKVRFWTLGPYGPVSNTRKLAAGAWADVSGNYPAAVAGGIEAMMRLRPPSLGRLALWHGQPGTGKTHAIRALAEAWQDWCDIDYIVDTDEFFGNGHYMASALLHTETYDEGEDRWRLIVVEDAGEFVRTSAKGQGLARLLNLADGLVGQGLQVMVLLTTNEPIEKLHPAMVRPGRCMSNIEFVPFTTAEAFSWLEARGALDAELADEAMTLAELYAYSNEVARREHTERRHRVNAALREMAAREKEAV